MLTFIKSLEQLWQLVGGNANTIVLNGEHRCLIVYAGKGHLYISRRGIILYRIGDKVVDDFVELVRIKKSHDFIGLTHQ